MAFTRKKSNKMLHFLKRLLQYLNRHCARRTIFVLGDSHALVFNHDLFKLAFPFSRFEVCSVGGATASGLESPNSKTQAQETFARALQAAPEDSTVLLLLGEVDTGFVIWYRAKKYALSVDEMMSQAVENYLRLIMIVKERHSPIVISTPLPTIADGSALGDVANQRKGISATQHERTELTIRFNAAIQSHCSSLGIPCLNLDKDSIGTDGIVRPNLLNSDAQNHHYKRLAHARLLLPKLRKVL